MSTISTSVPMVGAVRRQPLARRPASARRRALRQMATLVIISVALALLFVWVRVHMIQLGYEVSRIRKETTELTEQRNRLNADVAALKVPARIEAAARERFGMRQPESGEIVHVGVGAAAAVAR